MKFGEISGMTVGELKKKQEELRDLLFHSQMKNTLGQLGNPLSIRNLRRDIARIQTAIGQKSKNKER